MWQLPERRPKLTAALLFALAFAVRFSLVYFVYPADVSWRGEADRIAVALATRGEFADPFLLPTGPTAYSSPGWPLILSLVYRVFGVGEAGDWARILLIITSYSLLYALHPAIGRALRLPAQAGAAAGLFTALLPLRRTSELIMSWEEPLTAMMLAGLLILLYRNWSRDVSLAAAAAYGALWGLLLHFGPALLIAYGGVLLVRALLPRRPGLGRRVGQTATAVAATLLVLAPWTIRNRVQMGAWFYMRTNPGLEILISNNDLAGPAVLNNTAVYPPYLPGFSREAAQRVAELGEVEYGRRAGRQAAQWIKQNPGRFLELTFGRFWRFWLGPPETPSTSVPQALMTLAGFVGLALMIRHGRQRTPLIFASVWLFFPPVYYLVHVNPRYRAPMDWTVAIAAGYAAVFAIQRAAERRAGAGGFTW